MSLGECRKLRTKQHNICLNIYQGHFATAHSHMNYYIDISSNKSNLREADAIAEALAEHIKYTTEVNTILCLDGTEVIGACLARVLSSANRFHINAGNDIYVLAPEMIAGGQLYFRDNTVPMIKEKCILILTASVVTGGTVNSAIEAVRYYGGSPSAICSIFATKKEYDGIPVCSVFDPHDLEGYVSSTAASCPFCKRGIKITALVNSFGCSAL